MNEFVRQRESWLTECDALWEVRPVRIAEVRIEVALSLGQKM